MRDSKVIIRINYDAVQHQKEIIDPKFVTVWHVKRIVGALAILGVLVLILIHWLSSASTSDAEQSQSKAIETPVVQASVSPEKNSSPSEYVADRIQLPVNIKTPALIYDKRVVRAALVNAVKEGQPGESLGSEIQIGQSDSVQLFYFSQVKQFAVSSLLHVWTKDGKTVLKKRLSIKESKAKLVSSKVFTSRDVGVWRVILQDDRGKVFSEVNFVVNR